jgi:DNA-binding transcriptional MerR regulator
MSGQPARGYLGISEVLAQLRADFPDISVSKIRFLETEGLIAPARSPAGYRRFAPADLDRLRFILAAQRDQYLPLRVIRERLARLDEQGGTQADVRQPPPAEAGPPAEPGPPPGPPPGQPGPPGPPGQVLTRRELVEAAGMSEALLTELETFGLLRRVGRHYGQEALQVARAAVALTAYGVEARHLRAVRAAAERESTMIESLVAPIQRQRGAGARELAGQTARDSAVLVLRLHCALVEGALAEAGLVTGGGVAAGLTTPEEPGEFDRADDSGRRGQLAGGVEGASA